MQNQERAVITAKQELQSYLNKMVNPIVLPLVQDLLTYQPLQKQLPNFILNYIVQTKEKGQMFSKGSQAPSFVHSLCEQEDFIDQEQFKKKLQKRNKRDNQEGRKSSGRLAISAELYNAFEKKPKEQKGNVKKFQKTQVTKRFIKNNLLKSFLFQCQTEETLEKLINHMEVRTVTSGECIIKEGENGLTLFLVSEGSYDCFKFFEGSLSHIKTYKPGQIFGELAVMYNSPRQCTILAKTSGKLYTLDRYHFTTISRQITQEKRQIYRNFLSKVQILQGFTQAEKQKIADVLKQQKYKTGQYIFQEGDTGEQFYFVLEGRLIAEKKQLNSKTINKVYQFKVGDYFGQIALLKQCPRQASIKAISKCKVAYLTRQCFKRLLGSLQLKLQKNQQKYQKYLN